MRHDDVIKWKHFPRNWPFVREIHRSPVNFPHKGQWRGALMFPLIYAWINDWVNNHEAGDLRRQHGHYDVIVMITAFNYYHPADTWHDNNVTITSKKKVAIMCLIYRYLNKNYHWRNDANGDTFYLKTLDLSQVKIQCFLLTGHLYFCHRWHSTKHTIQKNAIIHISHETGLVKLWTVCLNQVSMPVTSNYIPQILWDVNTSSCPWYLLLTHKSSIKGGMKYPHTARSNIQITHRNILAKCVTMITSHDARTHDDVIKWKHFPRYWPIVQGIHRPPVNSRHTGKWCGALMFSLMICV